MNISPFKLLFRPGAALTAMLILAACSGGTTSTGLERGDGAAVAAGQPCVKISHGAGRDCMQCLGTDRGDGTPGNHIR